MSVKDILLLGNPLLYEVSEYVERDELEHIKTVVNDLHDTLMDFRKKYNCGRAIASPQIGFLKRLIYMNIDKPVTLINPILTPIDEEMFELWDDCMGFPDLLVKVLRYKRCKIRFRDIEWNEQIFLLEDDLSELLQHEYDHLDGILAVSRANDSRSIILKSQKNYY